VKQNAVVVENERYFVISRPAGRYRDGARRYRIEVDGNAAVKIGSGERIEVPISTAAHSVRARIDWSGSPAVAIAPGTHTPHLVVRPAGSAWSAIFQVFGRTTYLDLVEADPSNGK
jgi:hypothetical protein